MPNISLSEFQDIKTKRDQDVKDVAFYAQELCHRLVSQMTDYKVNMLTKNSIRWSQGDNVLGKRDDLSDYAKEQLKEIEVNGIEDKFTLKNGRKYIKLIHSDRGGHGSVHAFIDKVTGDVYKPASWNKPATHVRYNLLNEDSRRECFARADWAGGYLYMR